MINFFKKIINVFEKCEIEYMISGSIAMSFYSNPRASRDFDFVIHLSKSDIINFNNEFKIGYYCDIDSINEALNTSGMFNIIDYDSGFKADFIILKKQPFREMEFSRKLKKVFFNIPIWSVSAEDLFLSKLIWIQEIQSGIQLDDLKNLLTYSKMDIEYINYWILKLQLKTFNIF